MQLERFIHRIERTRGILALAVLLVSLLALATGLHGHPRGPLNALPVVEAAIGAGTSDADEMVRGVSPQDTCGHAARARPDVQLL